MLKKFICSALAATALISSVGVNVSAASFVPYLGYEYNSEEESVPAPVGYEPAMMLTGAEIGSGRLLSLRICASLTGKFIFSIPAIRVSL